VLDRYSAEARKAVGLAHDEARRLGHPHVGTEHLLLGLLAQGDNAAARALQRAGATLALCREKVTEALATRSGGRQDNPPEHLELTDRAARALDRAARLSARLKSDQVETSHVLVSVLDVEGTAGQVLRGLSVDLAAVRLGLSEDGGDGRSPAAGNAEPMPGSHGSDGSAESGGPDGLDGSGSVSPAEPAGLHSAAPEPVCATCGAPLGSALGHTVVASTDGVEFSVAYCIMCGATFGATRSAGP
jgi:ATP-dependent Clp protease ATP-binding subunit ClpC